MPPARRHALSLGIETLGSVMTVPSHATPRFPQEIRDVSTAADNQNFGRGQGVPGRAPWPTTTACWASSGWRHPARRHAAYRRSGDLRHRRQRHPSTRRPRTRATGKRKTSPSRRPLACRGGHPEKWSEQAQEHEAEDKKRRRPRGAQPSEKSFVQRCQSTSTRTRKDSLVRAPGAGGCAQSPKDPLESNREASDAEVFKGAFERLEKASHKMAEALYKAGRRQRRCAGRGCASGGDGKGTGGKDDVIDADSPRRPRASTALGRCRERAHQERGGRTRVPNARMG